MKIKIKTIDGYEFEVEGNDYSHKAGVHYLNGESFPDSIVVEVSDD